MATQFCNICSKKFNPKSKTAKQPFYVPICLFCRKKGAIDEYRCSVISKSTGERCGLWVDFSIEGQRCNVHRSAEYITCEKQVE